MSSPATTRGPIAAPASFARVAPAAPAQKRLQSLDVLRGVTVVLMILVNQSGDLAHTYRPLIHAPWNGLTFADVVFPCFLFMVGISLVLSVNDRVQHGAARSALVGQAIKRAVILFAIGVALNAFPWHGVSTLRIYGVLQRIAFCYLIAVLLYLWVKPRTLALVTAAILIGYYVLLRWVPVPGYGMPGVDVPFLDPHGNLTAWLDRQVFPASHLYLQGFYDPEGLLSSLPALASSLIGVLTGIELTKQRPKSWKWTFITGASCLAMGLVWSPWFPLNKRLWTSSFVLVSAGISLIVLGLLRWWLDEHSERGRALIAFRIFGINALGAYVFSDILAILLSSVRVPHTDMAIRRWLFQPVPTFLPNRHIAGLVCATVYLGICFLPVWVLYRRRIYLKV